MGIPILFYCIIIPAVSAILALAAPQRLRTAMAIAGTIANTVLVVTLLNTPRELSIPWAGTEFAFRLDAIAGLMLLATAVVSLMVVIYGIRYLKDTRYAYTFYSFLLMAVALINGALLSDNLAMMLFFWEGLLIPLFGMIATAHKDAYKTAVKAFVIVGVADLCLMFGIALTEHTAGTLAISQMHVSLCGTGGIAFIFMMIGAIAKAGAVPFHSWIPDAASETPLAFTAFFSGSLARLLGIYLLIRMASEMFRFAPSSWASLIIITVGIASIILGLFLAPAQKDPKKLLAYISIAVCGLLLVSIGSALPKSIEYSALFLAGSTIFITILFLAVGIKEQLVGAVTATFSTHTRQIAPLAALYVQTDQHRFDPYDTAMACSAAAAKTAFAIDRAVNWVYDGLIPFCTVMLSTIVRVFHTGNYSAYIIWSLAGTITIIALMVK
jgi:formate hydrogenlyase subunit 3/multisubunit Na+/H+ antiporter MnhD subunit